MVANVYGHAVLSDIGRFLLLTVIAAAYAEGTERIERLRRYVGYVENSMFANASSLWCFAAALVLPVGLAGAFTALLYLHSLLRSNREQTTHPYRLIYTGCTEVLAAMSAATIIGAFDESQVVLGATLTSLIAVAVAMVTYAVVNQGLVAVVLYLVNRPASVRSALMSVEDEATECTTLALAVLLGIAVAYAPYFAIFTVPLIIVVRRGALIRELQVQATHDAKTGLLNAGGWRREADRELVRAERTGGQVSVLMVDLDHFKDLNDSFGHPAGDATLKAVADCITDALRGYDAIGRFGGEEFIALLADADQTVSATVAERLCARIATLQLGHGGRVTASIGVGVGVAGSHTLDELVAVADKALYVAKNSGRDQVHVARAAAAARLGDRTAVRLQS